MGWLGWLCTSKVRFKIIKLKAFYILCLINLFAAFPKYAILLCNVYYYLILSGNDNM